METVQSQREHDTIEAIWAILRETAESQKETAAAQKETDRQMKENDRKFEKRFGKFGDRVGEMIEYMVMPNLIKKFRILGFEFTKVYPEASIEDKKNDIFTEIDLTLENGDKVMVVEVKNKPTTRDISDHVKRMRKVRSHADLHGDKRVFLGAVAGMIMKENERKFALKNGFYVIAPSGETFDIVVPEGIYSPREW